MHPKYLSINDFNYELSAKKIALFPLQNRDESKLLIYKDNYITEDIYKNIADHLPENSFLVFNNSKVIRARIFFQKKTGVVIEIFLLEPYERVNDYAVVFQKKSRVRWKCMIGGAGKWKEKYLEKKIQIHDKNITIQATLIEKLTDAYVIELSWNADEHSFAEIIESAGETPLPPYIKRKSDTQDAVTYQTIYAKEQGSVAAPTAGLHFTENIFLSLKRKNIIKDFVTLHVGAGTFKPVKGNVMNEHEMHAEWIDVSIFFIENLIHYLPNKIFCVGTTSVRTVESLYWMGVKTLLTSDITLEELAIKQWQVYEEKFTDINYTSAEALQSLLQFLEQNKLERFFIKTQIIIAPGYSFKIVSGMITNFHQPKSTLLLLVAALVGDKWVNIYEYALHNNFRFLSYGDGCLIFKDK